MKLIVFHFLAFTTAAVAENALHSCDFDNGLSYCGWTNDGNDNLNWSWENGPTGTSSTGPPNDHTTGTSAGYYMYLESGTSGAYSGYNAILRTPVFDISSSKTGHCIKFWYNMYGSTIGTLNVYVMQGSTEVSKVFTRSGNHGNDDWLMGNATITSPYFSYQVAFEATIGSSGTYGDIAIDDVIIYPKSCEDMNKDHTAAVAGLEDMTACCADNICSFPYNGYGYFLTPARSWPEARVFCQGLGGDLATLGVRSLSTRQAIADNIGASGDVWIGVNDVMNEGCFQWVDRFDRGNCTDDATLNWQTAVNGAGEINDCVQIRGDHKWEAQDVSCSEQQSGICEIVLPQCRS